MLEPIKTLNNSAANSTSSFLRSSGIFDTMSKTSSKSSIVDQLTPIVFDDGNQKASKNKQKKRNSISKCTYEVGDEFHHPYDKNNKHRVVRTVQLYTNLPWLVLCQNNLRLAKNELLYFVQKLEKNEDF